MANIQAYNAKIPSGLKFNISNFIFPDLIDVEEIELVISISQTNLKVKELSSYLEFIYRLDGYLSSNGFVQYSHYPKNQIEISEVRFGSIDLVFKEIFDSINAERIILVGLALKFLPKIINSILDIGIKYIDFQNKREDLIERRDKRRLRKNIREVVFEDETLQTMDKNSKEKLIAVLEKLYSANAKLLPATSRFISNSVKSIKIAPKKR